MKHTKEELEVMSDLQLNRIIAFSINKMEKCKETASQQNKGMFKDSPISTKAAVNTLNDSLMFFDYCNDPSDMMPLAFESKINMLVTHSGWVAFSEHDKPLESESKNPLRACAIVYILIKQ